jgi:hypothetical protein
MNENRRIARTLLRLAAGPGSDRVSVADLLRAFGPHAPAVLTLLFAVPNVLPMPPGTSAILGTPLLFMTVQLALGTPPWVPRAIGERSLSKATIGPAMRRIAAALTARHPLLRPRLQALVEPPAVRVIGAICSLLALILFLPIPFGNMLPALAISLLALGIVFRDGLCVLAGLGCASVGVGLIWAFAATFGQAALEALLRWLG